jgi:hypothetical protein
LPSRHVVFSGSGGNRTHSIPSFEEGWSPGCLPSQSSSGSWSRTNIVAFKARQPTVSRSPSPMRHPRKQDSVLGHHFSGHLPDPETPCSLAGSIWLAPSEVAAILRRTAFLCLVKQWCPDFPLKRGLSAPAMARDVSVVPTKKARCRVVTPGPRESQGYKSVSQAQTIDQQTAQRLTADAAHILAFQILVQRAGHCGSLLFGERLGLFRSSHSLDAGTGKMVHDFFGYSPQLIVLPSGSARRRSADNRQANDSKFSDCAPSDRARSGSGCTSMSRPSAPAASEAKAIAGT